MHATIVAFMGGAATVVCLQQLKGILGLDHFTHTPILLLISGLIGWIASTDNLIKLLKINYISLLHYVIK